MGCAQQRIDWLTFTLAGLCTDAQPPTILRGAAATVVPRLVLLITAGSVADEARGGVDLMRGARHGAGVTIDEADHVAGLATAPAARERRVTGFLEDALAAVQ